MNYQSVIYIDKEEAEKVQQILDTKGGSDDYGKDDVIAVFTAVFSNGCEADIKVCNTRETDSAPYVDPVLFDQDGSELCVIEVNDTLLGDYHFIDYDDNCYLVCVKTKETTVS